MKALARQTRKATDECAGLIAGLHTQVEAAVQTIGGMVGNIERVSTSSSAIAATVEQQAATVKELARGSADASGTAARVAENVKGLAQAAHETEAQAAVAHVTAGAITELATTLTDLTRDGGPGA